MRNHVLQAAALMAILSPMVAHATTITSLVSGDYDVTPTGVLDNTAGTGAKFSVVGGNAVVPSTTYGYVSPSFTVEELNGASILGALDAANGTPGAPITTLSGVTLNLYDAEAPAAAPAQYHTSVAGSVNVFFAGGASGLTSAASTPVYDSSAVGGLDNNGQIGSLDSLGTFTYTPSADNTNLAFGLTGTTGYNDLISAINSGSNFYIAVDANTPNTYATFGGGYGGFFTGNLNFGLAQQASLTVTAAVPEPASLGLLATSGLMLLGRRRRTASV